MVYIVYSWVCVECKYGEKVSELVEDTLVVVGHTVSAAMNIAKIQNVILPASLGMKNLGKNVRKSL